MGSVGQDVLREVGASRGTVVIEWSMNGRATTAWDHVLPVIVRIDIVGYHQDDPIVVGVEPSQNPNPPSQTLSMTSSAVDVSASACADKCSITSSPPYKSRAISSRES